MNTGLILAAPPRRRTTTSYIRQHDHEALRKKLKIFFTRSPDRSDELNYWERCLGFSDQSQCPLFQLPAEIRSIIYQVLFRSTTLTRGIKRLEKKRFPEYRRVYTKAHGLAIIRSCQRIRDEIGHSWVGQVLFDFHDTYTMLDAFTPLQNNLMSNIRNMRIDTKGIFLDRTWYRLSAALRLLPSLNVDVLHVFDADSTCSGEYGYRTVDEVVKYSSSWKELRFVSTHSRMLHWGLNPINDGNEPVIARSEQPATWQALLGNQASVVISGSSATDDTWEDETNLEIVIRRGPGSGSNAIVSSFTGLDILSNVSETSWEKIKAEHATYVSRHPEYDSETDGE